MKLRNNIFPRTFPDFIITPFLFFIVSATFYYELWIVVPTFHEPGSLWYNIHFICGMFVTINIYANFFATVLSDTSIKGEIMLPNENNKSKWRLCHVCEILTPPRSWHCNSCKTCILKRDHHCIFTGCCIGHRNQRYFFMMVTYLAIGTIYSTWFNHWFVWQTQDLMSGWGIFKIIFPLAMLVLDASVQQLHLAMYLLHIIGVFYTLFLGIHHASLIKSGSVDYEGIKSSLYNSGTTKNIENVFGKRWYLTWISPFISSPLSHDGIHWNVSDTPKTR